MSKRITLQTIADELGVSRATVSNAYNRPDQLKPELRHKVFETAKRLGYPGPDPAARRLRSGRSGSIGLLFTEELSYAFSDPAAILFLEGMARGCERSGTSLLMLPAPPGADPSASVRDAVVDGFCMYSMPEHHASVDAVIERGLPTVVADEWPMADASYVSIPDREGARQIAQHLLDLGHRRIAVLTHRLAGDGYEGPIDAARVEAATYMVTRRRIDGYRDALEGAGVQWKDVPAREHVNLLDRGIEATLQILQRVPRPTALLCSSDQLALGAMRAARQLGLDVPGDLSIVGFDDIPAAAYNDPPLTTIRQSLRDKGAIAAQLLFERMEDRPRREVQLPIELVVRRSSGPPPATD